MKAHVSSILLGVEDMDRSKRFYTEGLGWEVEQDYGVSVFFESNGGSLVGFYGRDGLAAQVGTSPEGSGFSGHGPRLRSPQRGAGRRDHRGRREGRRYDPQARRHTAVGRVRRFVRGPRRLHLEHRLQRPGKRPALRGVASKRSTFAWYAARREPTVQRNRGELAGADYEVSIPRRASGAHEGLGSSSRGCGGLGGGKRPAVTITINGHSWKSRVAIMRGRYLLGLSNANRKAAGVVTGDEVEVEVEIDAEPRVVVEPADFARALDADPVARTAYDRLSYSRKREHVLAIESAKKAETRTRLIEKALAMLREQDSARPSRN